MESSKILLGNKYYYMEMIEDTFYIREVTIKEIVTVETFLEGVKTKKQTCTDTEGEYIETKNLFKSKKDCINYYKKELIQMLKDERENN